MSSTGQECLNHLRFPEKEAVYWHVVARGGGKDSDNTYGKRLFR